MLFTSSVSGFNVLADWFKSCQENANIAVTTVVYAPPGGEAVEQQRQTVTAKCANENRAEAKAFESELKTRRQADGLLFPPVL